MIYQHMDYQNSDDTDVLQKQHCILLYMGI